MMGLLRFELKSQRPERCRMDQATLQPPFYWYRLSVSTIST